MQRIRRRRLRRVLFAAAGACVALSFAVPARAQDESGTPRPDIFRGDASSLVASVQADRDALLPVPEVFRFIALDGDSVFETDLQTARASLFFPGNGALQGPNLVCGTFGKSFPPQFAPVLDTCLQYEYPLTVNANSSDDTVETSGSLSLGTPTDPISAEALYAKAHADPASSTSDAAMQELRVLGLPGIGELSLLPTETLGLDTSVITVGSATSRTRQSIDEHGTLVVDAVAKLSGVRLIGGLIEIESIVSHSHATDDAAGHRTADASLDLGGVTVAGVPAQITEQGLVIGSPAGGPIQQQLQTAVNQLVEAMGVRITLLDVEETKDDGTGQAVASAGGLLIETSLEVQNLPIVPISNLRPSDQIPVGDADLNGTYVGSMQLGYTGAAAGATTFEDEAFVPDIPSDGFDTGFTPDDPGLFEPGTGDLPVPDLDGTGGAQPDDGSDPGPQLIRSVTDRFGGRMGMLYLAFMFAVLGICVMPRTFPARLPGARS